MVLLSSSPVIEALKLVTIEIENRSQTPSGAGIDVACDCARTILTIFTICDWIWENPPYGIRTRFAQCVFLVAQVEICQSPDFVIYMSNNPSNC